MDLRTWFHNCFPLVLENTQHVDADSGSKIQSRHAGRTDEESRRVGHCVDLFALHTAVELDDAVHFGLHETTKQQHITATTRLRPAVVELPSLPDAQSARPKHEGFLDLRLGRERGSSGEFDRAAVTTPSRVKENVEEKLRVRRPSLRNMITKEEYEVKVSVT